MNQKKLSRSFRPRKFSCLVTDKIWPRLEGDVTVGIDVGDILEGEPTRSVPYWILEERKKDRVKRK